MRTVWQVMIAPRLVHLDIDPIWSQQSRRQGIAGIAPFAQVKRRPIIARHMRDQPVNLHIGVGNDRQKRSIMQRRVSPRSAPAV